VLPPPVLPPLDAPVVHAARHVTRTIANRMVGLLVDETTSATPRPRRLAYNRYARSRTSRISAGSTLLVARTRLRDGADVLGDVALR
jgi:hypothetical protein